MPYMKEGYDLWAEAACSDVDRFKAAVKQGLQTQDGFFDKRATSKQILEWQDSIFRDKARAQMEKECARLQAESDNLRAHAANQKVLEAAIISAVRLLAYKEKIVPDYYNSGVLEAVIKLSVASEILSAQPSVPLLRKLGSRSRSGSFAGQNLSDSDWEMLKTEFQPRTLSQWAGQTAQIPIPYPPLQEMFAKAVESLQKTLPELISKAQRTDHARSHRRDRKPPGFLDGDSQGAGRR